MSPPLSVYQFQAMGSPCEILFEGVSEAEADRLGALAEAEARRIEHKFSRYRQDNILFKINITDSKNKIIKLKIYFLLNWFSY